MDIRCIICGSSKDIAPTHKDFQLASKNSNFPYICEYCGLKIQLELQKANDIYNSFYPYPHNPPQTHNA